MLRQKIMTLILGMILSICATGQISVQIDQIESCSSPVVVPVTIEDNVTLISLQFTIVWDQPELAFTNTQNPFAATGILFGSSTDTLSFSWFNFGGYAFTAGETLFEIVFDVNGTPGFTYNVEYCTAADCLTPLEAAAPGFVPVPVTPIDGNVLVSSDIPTIDCPMDMTVSNDLGNCGAIVSWSTPSVSDCDNNTTQTPVSSPASGSFFPIGTTTVNVSVSDNSGNPATCSFDVTVNDTEPPSLTCPTPQINISVPAGTTSINVSDPALIPSQSDNCPGATLSYVLSGATSDSGMGNANGESFMVGSTTVTYTLSDGTNSDQCAVIVNITEQVPNVVDLAIVGQTINCTDNTASIQVVIQDDVELISAQFNVNWDDPGLSYNSVSNVFFTSGVLFGPNSSEPYATGNFLTFTWFSSAGVMLNAGDVLFEINFDVTGNPGDCFNVSFFETPTAPPPPTELAAPGFVNVPVNLINDQVCLSSSGPVTMNCPTNLLLECGASTDISSTGNATANDGCNTLFTISHTDQVVPGCGNSQTITRTFTASLNGNPVETCQQTITVVDNTPPVFDNTPTPLNDISCTDALPTQETLTASNSCGTAIVVGTIDPFTPDECNGYTVTHRWVATDDCGLTTTVTESFNVLPDNINPVFTSSPQAMSDITCNQSFPVQETLTATDNCATITVVESIDPYTVDECNGYTVTYRWTASDNCGNVAMETQSFNVLPDNSAPTFNSAPQALSDISCNQSFPIQETLTATDNCATITVVESIDPYTVDECNGYTVTYRWTTADNCGNVTMETESFNVLPDNSAPTFNSAPQALSDISCNQSFPIQETLTATDNCATIIVVPSIDPFTADECNGYTVTYRWTAADNCGNVTMETASFNVLPDNTNPVFDSAPQPLADVTCGQNLPVQETLTATDNCATSVTVIPSVDPFTPDPNNPVVVTYRWTATDNCNNTSEVVQSFTLDPDSEAPVFDSQPTPLSNITCGTDFPIQETLTATDNCNAVTVVPSIDPFVPDACNGYMVTYRWTVSDANGNEAVVTESFDVLADTEAPTFSSTPQALPDLGCGEALPIQENISAIDNCDLINVIASVDPYTPDPLNPYTITYRWTATDNCGNTNEITESFTVSPDGQAPVFDSQPAALPDITCGSNFPTQEILTATDNCATSVTVVPSIDPYVENTCDGYIVTYRWTVTDVAGNTNDVSQTFNVLPDNEAPVFDSQPTAIADLTCGDPFPAQEVLTATDNCGTVNVVPSVLPFTVDVCNGYSVTFVWTATDNCGNENSTSVNFNYLPDSDGPVFDTQPIALPDLTCNDVLPSQETLTATDGCSGSVVDFSIDPFTEDLCNGYTVIHRWVATDDCMNETVLTESFTVIGDNEAPSFIKPADITLSCIQDYEDLTLTGLTSNLSDNCDADPMISHTDNASLNGCSGTGTIERTWLAEDVCGNVSSQIQTITIADTTAPELTCTDITIELDGSGNASIALNNLIVVASDICDSNPTSSLSQNTFTCSDIGENMVTITLTDDCGNVNSCTASVTVEDVTAPTLDCPENVVIDITDNSSSIVINDILATATDECGSADISFSSIGATMLNGAGDASGNSFNLGSTQVSYTATDESGNTTTCTFMITVNGPVTIECPENILTNAPSDACQLLINDLELDILSGNSLVNTISYDISGATTATGVNDASGTIFNLGTSVVNYIVTDNDGNEIACSFTVEVLDSTTPNLTCPNDVTITAAAGENSAEVFGLDPSYSDLCSSSDVSYVLSGASLGNGNGSVSGETFQLGTTTIEYTATDASGNESTCTSSVTVLSGGALDMIDCIEDIDRNANAGECGAIVNTIAPITLAPLNQISSISYTVTGALTTSGMDNASGLFFPVGVSTVEYVAEGLSGQTDTCSFIVTILDVEFPSLSCNTDIVLPTEEGICGATVNDISIQADDNCAIANISYTIDGATTASGQDDASGTFFMPGLSTVTYYVMDENGNESTCNFLVEISDQESPLGFDCPNDLSLVVGQNLSGMVVTNIPPTAPTDPCGIQSIAYTLTGATGGTGTNDASGTFFNIGNTNVSYAVTDMNGNMSICDFNILINDGASLLTCATQNISLSAEAGMCGATVTDIAPIISGDPSLYDAVVYEISGATAGAGSADASNEFFSVGNSTLTYSILSNGVVLDMCSIVVTIADDEAPTLENCPESITISANGNCQQAYSWTPPTFSDNCGISVLVNPDIAPGSMFPLGVTEVGYAGIDESGNVTLCVFEVTVVDNSPPVIMIPENIVVNNTPGQCGAVVDWLLPVIIDDCSGISTFNSSHLSGDVFPIGTTTVNYNATDGAGNSATESFTITVLDNELPTFNNCTPDNLVITPIGNCAVIATWDEVTASDNCGINSISTSHPSGSTFSANTTVTIIAIDDSGNINQCSFDISVMDNTPPSWITVPDNAVLTATETDCNSTHSWIPATAFDDCGSVNITSSVVNGASFNLGVNPVTLTATDAAGNSITHQFTVTVVDEIAPVVSCPDQVIIQEDGLVLSDPNGVITSVEASENCAGVILNISAPNATDNCGSIASNQMISGPDFSEPLSIGNYTTVFQITDQAGNSVFCNINIEVTELPDFEILPDPGNSGCEGSLIELNPSTLIMGSAINWIGPNNYSSNDLTPTIEIGPTTAGTYTLSYTSNNGCVSSASTTLTLIESPSLMIASNSPICDGVLTLTASTEGNSPPVEEWTWSGPCDFSATGSDITIPDFSVACAGQYVVTGATNSGCVGTQSITVESIELPPPVLSMACEETLCLGESCTLVGTEYIQGTVNYEWQSDEGIIFPLNTNTNVLQISTELAGTFEINYRVEVDGCMTEWASMIIEVLGDPEANDDLFEVVSEGTLSALDLTANDLVSTNHELQILAPPSNGSISINSDGTVDYMPLPGYIGDDQFSYQICHDCSASICSEAVVRINIIYEGECRVPTIITPNGDGKNDMLQILCLDDEEFPNNQLVIYNQWGDQVFKASPYRNDWDGTLYGEMGRPLPDGTYFYNFMKAADGEMLRGNITIFR